MPVITFEGTELDIPRNLAILDTNVLVNLALPEEKAHDDVWLFFECQDKFSLGVAPPVIAEACSFIIGKRKQTERAYWLLSWLLDPGTNILFLPAPHIATPTAVRCYLHNDFSWMATYKLDYVDAYLMQMANSLTDLCKLKPELVIVTADLRDFYRCRGKGYAYRLYDLASDEIFDMT